MCHAGPGRTAPAGPGAGTTGVQGEVRGSQQGVWDLAQRFS